MACTNTIFQILIKDYRIHEFSKKSRGKREQKASSRNGTKAKLSQKDYNQTGPRMEKGMQKSSNLKTDVLHRGQKANKQRGSQKQCEDVKLNSDQENSATKDSIGGSIYH